MTIITQNECLSADRVINYTAKPTALMLHLKAVIGLSFVRAVPCVEETVGPVCILIREALPCWQLEVSPFGLRVCPLV